jgi:hypothetical protein
VEQKLPLTNNIMFCKNCGNKIDDNSKFCSKCGNVTSNNKVSTIVSDNPNNSQNPILSTNTDSSDYLSKIIYTKSHRRLLFGYLLLAIAATIFIYQHNYISNLISGPRSISATSLESELLSGNIKDLNINLELLPDSVYQAGYTYVTQTVDKSTNKVESETTDQEYYLAIIGRHVLVLEGVPNQIPTGNFEGVIIPLSSDLQGKLVADFNNDPELSGSGASILPYALSNKGMMGIDSFWGFLFGIGLACWGGFLTYRRVTDRKDKKHYAYQIAPTIGYRNMEDFSKDFMNANEAGTVKIGGYKLSSKFLFRENFFSFEVYPMSQMFWAYKKVIKKSVNFIPTGKDYEVVIHFKPSKTVAIKESEENVNQHLMLLAHLCPEAKFGYTK